MPGCMDAPNTPCPILIILIIGYYKRDPNAKTYFHPPASPILDKSIHAVYGNDRRPPFRPAYCICYYLPNTLSWVVKSATYFTERKRNLQHVFLFTMLMKMFCLRSMLFQSISSILSSYLTITLNGNLFKTQ